MNAYRAMAALFLLALAFVAAAKLAAHNEWCWP
jgi:hypothetical protein